MRHMRETTSSYLPQNINSAYAAEKQTGRTDGFTGFPLDLSSLSYQRFTVPTTSQHPTARRGLKRPVFWYSGVPLGVLDGARAQCVCVCWGGGCLCVTPISESIPSLLCFINKDLETSPAWNSFFPNAHFMAQRSSLAIQLFSHTPLRVFATRQLLRPGVLSVIYKPED